MLVATPGQTASYPLHQSGATTTSNKKLCHASSSSASQPQNNCNAHKPNSTITTTMTTTAAVASRPPLNKMPPESSSGGGGTSTQSITSSSASAASALMKTLSVRLNRGTEFLKGTMQKALIASVNSIAAENSKNSSAAATAASSSSLAAATAAAAAAAAAAARNVHSFPPTETHRYPQEERLHAGSTDSLHKEMCHFKPIRSAPTTLWKCGTKSRGASLKFPQAKLATKKQQPSLEVCRSLGSPAVVFDVDADSDEDDEAVILRPKPSSAALRTTVSASSPSSSSSPTTHHPSAFVCLVTPMKSLAIVPTTTTTQQQQAQNRSNKSLESLHKTKPNNARGRTKTSCVSVSTKCGVLRHLRNPFVPVRKLNLPTPTSAGAAAVAAANEQLIVCRSTRSIRSNRAAASAASAMMALSSTMQQASVHTLSTVASKSKSKIVAAAADAKSKLVANSAAVATKELSIGGGDADEPQQRKMRKRKLGSDLNTNSHTTISSSNVDAALEDTTWIRPMPRKSARLSKDTSVGVGASNNSNPIATRRRQRRERYSQSQSHIGVRSSPPLTRSRLKQQLSHFKLNPALEYPHRAV